MWGGAVFYTHNNSDQFALFINSFFDYWLYCVESLQKSRDSRSSGKETMNAAQSGVVVNNLEYVYRDTKGNLEQVALKGLSFQAGAGKITALLGPNGSGKSTTFKILTTQYLPFRGEAFVAGNSVLKNRDKVRRFIGVTFQAPSLDPLLSVEENLQIHASLYGLKKDLAKKRIDEYLHKFGVADRKAYRVSQLSGGLARRVELAKAMLNEPEVLLLDEPTASLDPQSRASFWALLDSLRERGTCVIVSTHLIEEAEKCQHLVFVSEGAVVSSGSTEQYLSQQSQDSIELTSHDIAYVISQLKLKLSIQDEQIMLLGSDKIIVQRVQDLAELLKYCRNSENRISSFRWGQASLADVYMQKTGRELK